MNMKIYITKPLCTPKYEINTNCEKIMKLLYLQFGRYVSDQAKNEIYYRINISFQFDGSYVVGYDDKKIITDKPLSILEDIMFDTTTFYKNIIALHGAAVEYKGKAYILLAPTTSGKTTLTAYLTSNGFNYITEDCVLLYKNEMLIYPYTCPVHLRFGGVEVLKKYGINIENLELLEDASGSRYVYTPENYLKSPLPLGSIFFICRNEAENKICDMTVSESIQELMKSAITVPDISGAYIQGIAKIARTGCSRLVYSDMKYVADVIKEGVFNG